METRGNHSQGNYHNTQSTTQWQSRNPTKQWARQCERDRNEDTTGLMTFAPPPYHRFEDLCGWVWADLLIHTTTDIFELMIGCPVVSFFLSLCLAYSCVGFWQHVRQRIHGAVRLTLTLTLTLILMVMRHGLWVMRRRLNLMDCAFPEQDFQLCQYHSCHMFYEF